MEIYLLLISPLLVLIIKGPWQALLNLVLIIFGVFPGLIHLMCIIHEINEYHRVERFVRHVKRANRENP